MKVLLSGYQYYITGWGSSVKVGKWQTTSPDYKFDYCLDDKCVNVAEHEWAFDGQVFYKKVGK